MTLSSGWITRFSGALGIVAFVLYVISLQREQATGVSASGLGVWVSLAGAVVTLAAGLTATRHKHVSQPRLQIG